MKKILLEQEVLHLPNDKKWEYAVINGVWNARKIGKTNWINIETNPKVKNPDAINLLNSKFPSAKKNIAKTTSDTIKPTPERQSKLPKLDTSKAIGFIFPNGQTLKLPPSQIELAKSIIQKIGLDINKINGNTLGSGHLQNATAIKCFREGGRDDKFVIFPNINTLDSELKTNLQKYCEYGSNISPEYKKRLNVIEVPLAFRPEITAASTTNENSLKSLIKNVLKEYYTFPEKKNLKISKELQYHIDNNISLSENVFRIYSEKYFDIINEARELYNSGYLELIDDDIWLIESDLGKKVKLNNGDEVYLDAPIYEDEVFDILSEAKHRGKNVNLNSPFRTPGGPKKFAVYVKTPKGTIKKVTFGDPNLKVRNANKKAAKSFNARHKCSQKKDRTTAGYWSCNVGRYAKKLGLKSKSKW